MSHKLNNEAINAIKRTLNNVLIMKAERIAEAAYEKDLIKIKKADKEIVDKLNKLSVEVKKYKVWLEKNSNLTTAYFLDNVLATISCPLNKMVRPKTIDSQDSASWYTNYNYGNSTLKSKYQSYLPKLKKEENEIEQYILSLLLGEETVNSMNDFIKKLETM